MPVTSYSLDIDHQGRPPGRRDHQVKFMSHRIKVLISRLVVVLSLLLSTSSAQAVLRVEITKGVGGGLPVAIVPFKVLKGEIDLDLAQIVADDLERSGKFDILDRANLISSPGSAADVKYQNWRVLGQDYIVVGNIEQTSVLDYRVTFELLDVIKQKSLAAFQYQPRENQLRRSAHKIADAVIEAITGNPGAFDTHLVYVSVTERESLDNRRFHLQVADSDGASSETIVSQQQPLMSPAWSPDGNMIAYVSFENPRRSAIYVQDRFTGRRRVLASFEGINGAPAWSPDGKQIAVTLSREGSPDLHLIDVATGRNFQLTRNLAIETEPAWSPDGETIYFTSDRAGAPQIYRIPAEGGKVERVTYEGSYNASADISPDGRLMTMVHRVGKDFRIAVMDLKNNLLDVLTSGRLDESPSFSPNGEMIIYATEQEGRGVLGAVSTDGAIKLHMPLSEGEVREPAWSPNLP